MRRDQCSQRGPIRGESDRHDEMRPAESGRHADRRRASRVGRARPRASLAPIARDVPPTRTRGTQAALSTTPAPKSSEAASAILDRSRAPDAPRSPPRRSITPAQWTAQSPRASTSLRDRRLFPDVRGREPREDRPFGLPRQATDGTSVATECEIELGLEEILAERLPPRHPRRRSPSALGPPVGTGLRGWSAPATPRRWPAARSPNPVTHPGPRTPFLRALQDARAPAG